MRSIVGYLLIARLNNGRSSTLCQAKRADGKQILVAVDHGHSTLFPSRRTAARWLEQTPVEIHGGTVRTIDIVSVHRPWLRLSGRKSVRKGPLTLAKTVP